MLTLYLLDAIEELKVEAYGSTLQRGGKEENDDFEILALENLKLKWENSFVFNVQLSMESGEGLP